MKKLPLLQHINLLRLSEHTALFHGPLFIKDMERLTPSLYNEEGEVVVDLTLSSDSEGIRFCRVELKTELTLQCQRCLEPYKYEIISDFLHGIAHSEKEAEGLPEQYEPFVVKDGVLVVQDMIEDELLLKLPIVPMHSASECKVKLPYKDAEWNQDEEKGKNPFQVLKLLKRETK